MAESPADDSSDDHTRPPDEAEIGAAVNDAMDSEIRRQKARFVQHIIGLDRIEGVGRRDEQWDDGFHDRHQDPPVP
jgi:hypothetical protein